MFCKTVSMALSRFYRWLVKRLYFSITFKITTVYAMIFILIMFLFNTVICAGFIAYLGKNAEDKLMKDFQIVSSYLIDSKEFPTSKIDYVAGLDKVDITVYTETNEILYSTLKEPVSPVIFEGNPSQNNVVLYNRNYYFILPNHQFIYEYGTHTTTSPFALILKDSIIWKSSPVYIQITDRLEKEAISVAILVAALFSVTFFIIIIVILIGWKASKSMLRPLDKMTKTVKNITINDLDTRLDVGGSQDELKELAQTFNGMLDRIQLSYEQQNQFVSDASHELRTPISVIQGYANLLDRWGKNDPTILQESIESIKIESENMKDLIERLLFLARGDKNTQKIDKEAFSLSELVEEVIRESKLIDNSHEITSQLCESIIINADLKLIKEALRVFVDNSIKYTPEGGKISINCYSQNSQAVITIEDTGIGISKEDIPHIFNRFYRADKSRTKKTGGTGLGLAIANWIIQKHKGTIKVDSKVNEGTKISIFIPLED